VVGSGRPSSGRYTSVGLRKPEGWRVDLASNWSDFWFLELECGRSSAVLLFDAQNDSRAIPIEIHTMVKPTSFRFICCCCHISIHSTERYSFSKLSESIRKIRDTARSRREASSSAFPISSSISGLGQDCHDWNQNQDFFRYTAGRFLFEEISQMACRYVKFDMNELVHIAASSIASRSCVAVRKLPEGQ